LGAAQVMVIPSVHRLLGSNPHYSYARLYDIVAGFRPDLVGVEIRQEDLGRGSAYLQRNYPREMVELADRYRDRAFGFDWLGDELVGRPVPDDWWAKQSRIKQLEHAFDVAAPHFDDRMKRLNRDADALSDRQAALAASATAGALAAGAYDTITAEYYRTVALLTRGTPYALLPQWYAERDHHLDDSVVAQIRLHAGCRIVVVTGADHHGPMVARISALGGGVVLVLPVP
jgi:hypothetical protein